MTTPRSSLPNSRSSSSNSHNHGHSSNSRTSSLSNFTVNGILTFLAVTFVVVHTKLVLPSLIKAAAKHQLSVAVGALTIQQEEEQQYLPPPLTPPFGVVEPSLISKANVNNTNHHHGEKQQTKNQQQQSSSLWKNVKYDNVVHIIQTRFMQHQPNLTHLGEARLHLLEAITLPSLLHQTNHDFLWILRTDPNLDSTLQQSLFNVLTQATRNTQNGGSSKLNVIVLASNEHPELKFRSSKYLEARVVYGSPDLLKSYHVASQNRMVLETRLDADDALALNFVETIQRDAASSFSSSSSSKTTTMDNNDSSNKLRFFCIDAPMEWKYQNPTWDDDGRSSGSSDQNPGYLLPRKTNYCVTPGLSVAYSPNVDRSDVTISFAHHKLHKSVPSCSSNNNAANNPKRPCLYRISAPNMALRGRTITSIGMQQVQVTKENLMWKQKQDTLWRQLPSLFGMSKPAVIRMRSAIESNIHNILPEALEGQCTPILCKEQARVALQSVMKNKNKNANTVASK